MLDRFELSIAMTAVLLGAVLLGWLLRWLWVWLTPRPKPSEQRMGELIALLHETEVKLRDAETARDAAKAEAETREADAFQLVADLQSRLDGQVGGREADLMRELREAKVDAETSMDGLRNARIRISELEAELGALRREAE